MYIYIYIYIDVYKHIYIYIYQPIYWTLYQLDALKYHKESQTIKLVAGKPSKCQTIHNQFVRMLSQLRGEPRGKAQMIRGETGEAQKEPPTTSRFRSIKMPTRQ